MNSGTKVEDDGDEALHVADAAAIEPAVLPRHLPGIGVPGLAVDRHHVGVAGQRDARLVGGPERGIEVGLLAAGVMDQPAFDAMLRQVGRG